jgi:1-acyl-sn-glycerol-3-phosphate acyltransferase
MILRLYFSQVVIQGMEHLPVTGPVVLAPKHYSRWDPLVLALLSRQPFWFMTNANQFFGIQGWLIQRLGAFPVDPLHPKPSSLRYAIALLQAKERLVLFPEGGIVRDRPLRPLKSGLARLVMQAEAIAPALGSIAIVPIALHYQPTSQWRAKIIIRICPPLYATTYRQKTNKLSSQAITQALEDALLSGLGQIKQE